MDAMEVSRYAGMTRQVQVALRLAPTHAAAAALAKSLAAILDEEPRVAVSLVALDSHGSRIHLTLAVTLGTLDEVKTASGPSCAAVVLLHRIARDLAHADPSLVVVPDPRSREAMIARHLRDAPPAAWSATVARLATVG